jgi:hypothetical protein
LYNHCIVNNIPLGDSKMNRPEPRDGFDTHSESVYRDSTGFVYYDENDSGFPIEDQDEDSYPYYGDEDDYDGQPSEYDEWMSFDPDC